jgi:hypothetical protein
MLLQTRGHNRADMQLLSLAIRKGWDIPEPVMAALPARVLQILTNKETPVREQLRGVEAIMAMREQDATLAAKSIALEQDQQKLDIEREKLGKPTVVAVQQNVEITAAAEAAGKQGKMAADVAAMDALILPPEVIYKAAQKQGTNGNGSSHGNGDGHA